VIQLRMSIFFKKENWFESSVDIFRTLKAYVLSRKKRAKEGRNPVVNTSTEFSLTRPIHRHLHVVMPTLRAGDDAALARPTRRVQNCKTDTNKDTINNKSMTAINSPYM